MSHAGRWLHAVQSAPPGDEAAPGDLGDVGVVAMIFLVSAVPLASVLVGIGRWDHASLGLGTLGILLAGRELGTLALATWRNGRRA